MRATEANKSEEDLVIQAGDDPYRDNERKLLSGEEEENFPQLSGFAPMMHRRAKVCASPPSARLAFESKPTVARGFPRTHFSLKCILVVDVNISSVVVLNLRPVPRGNLRAPSTEEWACSRAGGRNRCAPRPGRWRRNPARRGPTWASTKVRSCCEVVEGSSTRVRCRTARPQLLRGRLQ